MVQSKCNGCNQYFKGSCGLSNHFQFNRGCKAVHLNLIKQYQVIPDKGTQVDNNKKKMAVSQTEELITRQCEVDSESNEICKINDNTNIEESSIDTAPFASMPTEDEGIYLTDTFMHTNEIRVENNLLKLVSDMNAFN